MIRSFNVLLGVVFRASALRVPTPPAIARPMNLSLFAIFSLCLALWAPSSAFGQACAPAWVSTTAYTGGNTVSENGINYVANWWTQGQDPATNNGGAGSGQPWTSQGACGGGSCSSAPGAPTGLSASGTTSSSTNLSWSAVTPPSNCSISSYTVYQGGTSIGTTAGTSFNVTGLSASSTYTFTVAATDSSGTGAQSSSISVTTSAASCTSVPSAPSGLAASNTTSSGTMLNWNAVSAPANCSISGYTVYQGGASIGTTSGTSINVTGLAASTAYSFTVAATDSAGTGSQSASISVTTQSGSSGEGPFGGTPAAVPGTVSAANYDTGGQGVAYNVSSTNGSANGYRSDGIDLETTSDGGGVGYDLGWTASGQWFKYTVNVSTAGSYTVSCRVAAAAATGTTAGSFHIQNASGTNLTGSISVPGTGGWQTWTTVTANLTLPAGQQTLEIYQDTGGYNFNWFQFASSGSGSVAAPTFSIPAGTYNTVIGVNLSTSTMGATVHYTTDGSTPTASSPQFYGAIWISNGTSGATTTVNAVAVLNGVSSAVSSATYTITANNRSAWNGNTTINIVNGANGEYSDSQIYWFMIGIDWATGNFVHVDINGNLVPMSLSDDTVPVSGQINDYANYSYTLAQTKSITIPAIESARIYISYGSPVLLQVNTNGAGQVAYAGPNLDNPSDPNQNVLFDFGEFNINPTTSGQPGVFVNTTRVDMFGIPIRLNVQGLDGYNATVGEPLTETRSQIISEFGQAVPAQFQSLAQAPYTPYRIVAPTHGSFAAGATNGTYLDSYIASVWNQLKTTPVTLNLNNGWGNFTGSVNANNVLTFTDGSGSYIINGIPTTQEVMLGNGKLNDPTGTTPGSTAYLKQLQLQAQVCAALNRHVAEQTGDKWWNSAYFYPAGSTSNWYTKFWHDHSIDGLAYGHCYDDVGGYSPSIYTPSPTAVTFTVGQ